MVYKLGRRVKPKMQRTRLFSLVTASIVLVGTLASAYADSRGITSFGPYPFHASSQASSAETASASIGAKSAATSGKTGLVNTSATAAAKQAAAASVAQTANPTTPTALRASGCNLFTAAIAGLANAQSSELRKLSQYEQLCGNLVDRLSFFVATPTTATDAASSASDVANTLKEFACYGVKPLVFLEPDNMSLTNYQNGAYDTALDTFFKDLQWGTTNPTVFAADVTKTAQFQKKYFPTSLDTIMLDSESYADGASWGQGQYVSLLPYVQGIPKGLLDSFGLQGFPWAPAANDTSDASDVYSPATYLRSDFAAEAARSLGVTSIWFNTGTFSRMYTNNSAQTVTASATQRQAMLDGTIAEAKGLQGRGFSVSIHLFNENKSSTSEAIDWSYWDTAPGTDANTTVFTTFVHDAKTAGIPIWLFDTDDHDD
jgi:hypothetical protein